MASSAESAQVRSKEPLGVSRLMEQCAAAVGIEHMLSRHERLTPEGVFLEKGRDRRAVYRRLGRREHVGPGFDMLVVRLGPRRRREPDFD